MKFRIEKRDLFTVPKDYFLCHCISADFALGAGMIHVERVGNRTMNMSVATVA